MPRDPRPHLAVVRDDDTPAPASRKSAGERSAMAGRIPPLTRSGRRALVAAIVTGLFTHGYRLFQYPLYLTDEGIYMQRAWSLVRQTSLSPYTYTYDHAPGGWIVLAGWAFPLPRQFETFGNAINTGRFLMLLVHLASVYLLFEIVRRLSDGSVLAASVSAFLYNVSPLAIYYQRQVLLDNIMMFWVLLSLFSLLRDEIRIRHALAGGMALGIALITKENAVFFLPAFAFLLWQRIRTSSSHRFGKMLWPFALTAPVGGYVMYAILKSEFVPSGLEFGLDTPPADHVSLLYTAWWQVNRNQGTLLSQDGFLYTSWLPRDRFLLLAGMAAMIAALILGMRDRRKNAGFLVAGGLALGYAFYLLRGSVVLDFYVAPLVPLFAMNIGMVTERALKRVRPRLRIAVPAAVGAVLLLSPPLGYLMATSDEGRVQFADQHHLRLTDFQERQVQWIRENVPADARIIMDDDIWSELHDVRPFYPLAHSHWNAASDPDVRDKLFARDSKNIDYIVMSNKMREAIDGNNGDGREDWILAALKNSEKVWEGGQGDIRLEIFQVRK